MHKRFIIRCSAFTIAIALLSFISSAQDLEQIGKATPLSITGGMTVNQIFYAVDGIQSRREPYTCYASGNLNLSLYGWSLPVSFNVTNRNTTFHQPFNQYSIHPSYKSITGHFGYTSMSYSPYTVNGHIFLGGAVDVAPEGRWKLSALYGRFLKAVEPDSTNGNETVAAFKRMGYGLKATYSTGKDFIDFTLFHASDDINSIHYIYDSLEVLPQENLVLSIGAGKSILKNFLLKGEFASSALSHDVRAPEANLGHPLGNAKILYTARQSSSFYHAFKTSFDYQHEVFLLGIAYERIDPHYRTLGAYYFNNDLVDLTVNGSTAILQGKMNIAISAGSQHDNLDKSKISTMNRLVGSLNINYTPSQKLNLSASYSNFQTYTNIRSQFQQINQLTPYENLDTLNFTQLSQNANANAMYTFGMENRRQHLMLNLSIQDAADRQGDVPQNSGMRFYNGNVGYAINLAPQRTTISISWNGSVNNGAGLNTKTYGPVVSVSRLFFDKKLRTTLSSTYNNTFTNAVKVNGIINGRFTSNFTIQKKHNVNVSSVVVNRASTVDGAPHKTYTEFTGTVGYSYNFSVNGKKSSRK